MLNPGDTAPDFTLPATGGDPVTLSALRPDRVVLFFYPKDGTPACTDEALAFSTLIPRFSAAGVQVFGISKDSLKKHENAVAKNTLGLRLLSDAKSQVCEDWGVWAEKKMYGKTYMGIVRSTFLIGAGGQVEQVWSPVKVPGHAEAVLAEVGA